MTTIAAATSADLPALLELLGQSALPTAGLADHLDTTLVAHEAGHVVGSAALELYGTTALLRSVAVAPGLPGRGLGQALHRPALPRIDGPDGRSSRCAGTRCGTSARAACRAAPSAGRDAPPTCAP